MNRGIKKASRPARLEIMVGMRGLEPPRCHHHRLLRPARLPVPPHPRVMCRLYEHDHAVSRLVSGAAIAAKCRREIDRDDVWAGSGIGRIGKSGWRKNRCTGSRSTAQNSGTSNTDPRSMVVGNHTNRTGTSKTAGAGKQRRAWVDRQQFCCAFVAGPQPIFSGPTR